MPRIFQKLLGGLWWVLNFRPLRLFALLAFVLWGFDCVVTFWTDAMWFSSLGLSATFWHSRLLQLGLFTAFFVGSLAFAIPFLRVVAKPVDSAHSAVSFPRALDFLGHWHALAPKLSWLVVLLTAFLCAHNFGANWMAFEAMRYTPNLWGLNERFWLGTLPFASLLLGLVWKFSVVLLVVVALGGGVRSLPFLATREPIQPVKWLRALVFLGVLTIGLRALGYFDQIFGLARGSEMTGFETYIKAPVFVFGFGLCSLAALGVLRGAKRRTLLFSIGAALLLPAVSNAVLSPLFFWLPSPFDSGPAKQLAFQSPHLSSEAPKLSFEASWPVWIRSQLIDAARERRLRDAGGQVLDWRKIALFQGENSWYAGVVGQKVPIDASQFGSFADSEHSQEWMTLNLGRISNGLPVEEDRFKHPTPAYYGLEGERLFSNEIGLGVDFGGLRGLLWAWRFRSPLLMLEGARQKRLLPFRGTQQAAQQIAPMFRWSEARPVRENGVWFWICDGYGVSSDFPNVQAKDEGFFEGHNFARLSVRAIQNPSTGEIRFAPPVMEQEIDFQNDPIYKTWRQVFPEMLSGVPESLDLETTLDEIELLTPDNTPIWTNGARLTTLDQLETQISDRKKLIEVEGRLTKLDDSMTEEAKSELKDGELLERGIPCVWKEGRVWWIGVGYFVITPSQTTEELRDIRLHRVAVTQLGTSTTGQGDSAASAKFNYTLKRQLEAAQQALVTTNANSISPEIRALQAHERAQKALRERDMVTYGKESDLEKKLLEEIIKRKNQP